MTDAIHTLEQRTNGRYFGPESVKPEAKPQGDSPLYTLEIVQYGSGMISATALEPCWKPFDTVDTTPESETVRRLYYGLDGDTAHTARSHISERQERIWNERSTWKTVQYAVDGEEYSSRIPLLPKELMSTLAEELIARVDRLLIHGSGVPMEVVPDESYLHSHKCRPTQTREMV